MNAVASFTIFFSNFLGENHGEKPFNARRESGEHRRMVDITRDKPVKVTVRVIVPVRDHPKVSKIIKHAESVHGAINQPLDCGGSLRRQMPALNNSRTFSDHFRGEVRKKNAGVPKGNSWLTEDVVKLLIRRWTFRKVLFNFGRN